MAQPENQAAQGKKTPAAIPGVRTYDFRMVRKLSQNQRIRLGAIQSRFAAALPPVMEAAINCKVETSFLGFEQVQGAAFNSSDYADSITATYELASSHSKIYSIWPREIAFFMMERKLGSTGDQLYTEKTLTDFEKNILKRFGDELFSGFKKGFEKQQSPEGVCNKIMEGVEPFSEMMPYEVLLISRINLNVKKYRGVIVMIYPYSLAKSWMEEGSDTETTPDLSWKESAEGMPSSLGKASLRLTVKTRKTPIKISDFNQLQVGDCILLNQSINDPFEIYIGKQSKFQGYLGTVGNQLAAKITRKLNKTQDTGIKNNQQEAK